MPQIPAERVEEILDFWPVARLATLDAAGHPFQVPIVFVRHGGRIWSPVDAKPKRSPHLSRLDHVRARPETSLLLDHYAEDWDELWWLRIRTRAEVALLRDSPELCAALELALREKYPQYRRIDPFLGEPTALAFSLLDQRSWCADLAGLPRSTA